MMIKLFLIIVFNIVFIAFSFANGTGSTSSWWTEVPSIPELTGQIYFYEEWGAPIDINNWEAIFWTPVVDWEYWEKAINTFINKNIEVSFYCTSTTCDSNTVDSVLVTENWTWTLNIVDNLWRSLSVKYHVWKINKTDPIWSISYVDTNDTWVNWSKIAKLTWSATKFGDETWNTDWLVWNASPSFTCDIEWWCTWNLSITDSAWNTLIKSYNIKNIDKTLPEIEFFKYAEIVDWKQKIWVTCTDNWWSGCSVEWEVIYYLARWTHIKCVSDNAWNEKCWQVVATSDVNDFSDTNMWWKKWTRKLWLACQDDMSWCVDSYKELIVNINWLYQITIKDNANITTTKQFLIEKLDNIKPEELNINAIFNPFKASDQNKIKVSWDDYLSWPNSLKYKWNQTCNDGVSIYWTEVINNEIINYTVSWNHILYLCMIDNVWNIREVNKSITIYPWDLDQDKTTIELNWTKWILFANNWDKYTYIITLRDKYNNLIYNKDIDILEYSPLNISDTIQFNMTTPHSWEIATNLNYYWLTSNSLWEVRFFINSYVPWEFVERFKINMNKWWQLYIDNSQISEIYKYENSSNTNIFKKPLQISEFKTISDEVPQIWKDLDYKIKLDNIWNVNFINGFTYLNQNIVKNKIIGHYWNKFDLINKNLWWTPNISELSFSWNIDATENLLKSPKLEIELLEVNYNIAWKTVKYNLDNFEYNWTSSCDVETLWVKIIGSLQWDWKADQTWQKSNISDLSKWSLRWEIRKNAYLLIKNRTSSKTQNINWVIYIDWDVKYSEVKNSLNPNDTIIIKNWNFIIDENIDKNLWIIVLKDNYDMNYDYNKEWNIYIKNDVTYINALIYADWAIRSANNYWVAYNDSELWNRLELFGSIFTRNTIWWAVIWWNSFTLPWGQTTIDYDLAEIYDLNYIRKFELRCDWTEDDWISFIIKFNPKNQINPPKWFSK